MDTNFNKLKITLNKEFVCREIEDTFIVINLSTGYFYMLNETGRYIFNAIKDGQTSEEILKDILKKYDSSEEEIRSDVSKLLNYFINERIFV